MESPNRHLLWVLALVLASALALPAGAAAEDSGGTSAPSAVRKPPRKARIVDGKAVAPRGAPRVVRRVIAAANRISRKPYRYGGGHGRWRDSGYDCSGAVSYALHGGRLVSSPLTSGGFMRWGKGGRGRWITVYAHSGHVFMVVAGLRFDTGYRDPGAGRYGVKPGSGPRWNRTMRPRRGYRVRQPR